MTVIALPAAGDMGAGLGRVLVANGATVLTRIQGRSAATVARADQAGMRPAEFQDIARADLILSVVPPAIAVETAEKIVAALTSDHRPIYVDLNAISPARTAEIATIVAPVAEFVDGGIVGGPPRLGITGLPVIYLSGPAERAAHLLGAHGLSVRPIEGGIGAASALKLSYAGITKGLTGLTAAMLLAAERAGIGDALHAEMSNSLPQLLARAEKMLPDMYPKAYRWVDEMDQIATFLGDDRPEAEIWRGLAALYQSLAEDRAGSGDQIAALDQFLERPPGADRATS